MFEGFGAGGGGGGGSFGIGSGRCGTFSLGRPRGPETTPKTNP